MKGARERLLVVLRLAGLGRVRADDLASDQEWLSF